MTAQNRSVNKARFENGDTPQGSDFTDFIDSYLALTDSTAQSVVSLVTFSGGLATTTVSANNVVAATANIGRCFTNFVQITNSASESNWVFTVETTVAASGGSAGAVPASAAGFLHVQVNGTLRRIAFFNPK